MRGARSPELSLSTPTAIGFAQSDHAAGQMTVTAWDEDQVSRRDPADNRATDSEVVQGG
jgi:hypothetical protein